MKVINDIIRNAVNIPGWSTKRHILVIESDDWGSIRVRSNEDTEALIKAGFDFTGNSFYQFDGLESNDDVEGLMNVLYKFRDINGNHPIFTLACNVANPDFDSIERNNFEEYIWESTLNTYSKYPAHDKSHELLKEGLANKLFQPVFHGREHLNVQKWMRLLQSKDKSVMTAFRHGGCSYMYGVGNCYIGNMPAAFDLENPLDLGYQKITIIEGLDEFEHIWGKRAGYFVSPNGPINNSLETVLSANGIYGLLGERHQREPLGNGKYITHIRFIGSRNSLGQVYLTRNGFLEPSIQEANLCQNALPNALKAVERAFRWHKPAVISSHRINYIGYLSPENRTKGLKILNSFLTEVKKIWPDVEFMSSTELVDIIKGKKYGK